MASEKSLGIISEPSLEKSWKGRKKKRGKANTTPRTGREGREKVENLSTIFQLFVDRHGILKRCRGDTGKGKKRQK